jgi:hypothetical protein
LPEITPRHRIRNLLVVCLMLLLGLLLAMILGTVLPEPAVTVLLFVAVGVVALWKRSARRRFYAGFPAGSRWQAFGRIVAITLVTLLAAVAMASRQ